VPEKGRRRLNEKTMLMVRRAWKYLLSENSFIKEKDDHYHWVDFETGFGILKDVDALNALVEPFLLAPEDFADPPLKAELFCKRVADILEARQIAEEKPAKAETGHLKYRGFSSDPYAYFSPLVDFVDSAASFLNLVFNTIKFSVAVKEKMPQRLEKLIQKTILSAIEFLDESCIVDKKGARWSGVLETSERNWPGKYANLYFTYSAATALRKTLDTPRIQKELSKPLSKRAEEKLKLVPTWIDNQYDDVINAFWIDEARSTNRPISILYALESVYRLQGRPTGFLHDKCKRALSAILDRMSPPSEPLALQTNLHYLLPNPKGNGYFFYDDRKHIASFLSLLSMIKTKDPSMVDQNFLNAGEHLFDLVIHAWVDKSTGLWDNERPLICFTYDALRGLVDYSTNARRQTK
jgi:hypothetical protein